MNDNDIWQAFERMQGEIAREIRVLLGEEQYDQRIFTYAERARRVEAMRKCAAERTTDSERHEAWCAMHREQGWVHGPAFRPDLKQHPNLLPWNELSASTRSKAQIFAICSRYAAELSSHTTGPEQA